MKKILVLLLSLVLLVSLACPIFASAAIVDVPSQGEDSVIWSYNTGTTGGGTIYLKSEEALLCAVLYMACDQFGGYPPFITFLYELEVKVIQYIRSESSNLFLWAREAGNDLFMATEPIEVPISFINIVNDALKANGIDWRVRNNIVAFGPIPKYSALNDLKSSGGFFLNKQQYTDIINPPTTEETSFWGMIKEKFINITEYVKNGFINIDTRFLNSFTTFGNQLYAIRDKISEGTKPLTDYITELKDKFGEGVQDIIDNSWIGETFQPDNFEDESFNQYDDFLDELEDDRLALLDKIDSFEIGFAESIQEISSALIFVSMVFGVFAQIPFLQTIFNVSLALGMTATVLGLVPLIADKFSNKKGEYK